MLVGRILAASLALCGALCVAPAHAQTGMRTIDQYKHTRWLVDDGAPAPIYALVQGRDGYLYIGAGDGLYRFDGIGFDSIRAESQPEDRGSITALLAARDGSVWVGYGAGGIARYSAGTLRDTNVPNPIDVMRLAQTDDGAIWAQLGRIERPLVRFSNGRWTEIGANWGLPALQGADLIVARDGTLWFSARDAVYFLRKGSHKFERTAFRGTGLTALAEDRSGTIWASDQATLRPVLEPDRNRHPPSVPYGPRRRHGLFDRRGAFWGNTSVGGIYKIPVVNPSLALPASTTDRFRETDSLTSDQVNATIEDREGSIWVGTQVGLDRFRQVPITAERSLELVPQWGSTLLAVPGGDVYVGQHDGVYRISPGGDPEAILPGYGEVEAMCQAKDGALWFVMQDRIVRFRDRPVETIRKPASREALIDCAVDGTDTLYVTAMEGMFQRTARGWRLFAVDRGYNTDGAMPIISRADGSLLTYASSRSLRVYRPPRFNDVVLGDPIALRNLKTLYARQDDVLAGGAFGLVKWQGNTFSFLTRRRVPALRNVFGIAASPDGYTWLMARSHIVRIATTDLDRAFATPDWVPPVKQFDYFDGLPGGGFRDGKRDAVRGGDGRIWFATTAGVVWIDPSSLSYNASPPPVAIGALHVNGHTYRDPLRFDVPAGTARIAIDFSALSLAIPQRVQVRYQLEGVDAGWIDAGKVRTATYINLEPGQYRFRVIAANEDGVWNRRGAMLQLTIAPTFVQSSIFSALCVLAALLILWLAYFLRSRQLTARERDRLGTQIAERERIARELHDTLLQGFQGLVLRFQSIANRMARDDTLRGSIDEALDRAEGILTDARNRVSDLRFTDSEIGLFDAIAGAAAKLGGDPPLPISVTVEGEPRSLTALASEELLRLAEEAIRNAVQHSEASRIEVVLGYGQHVQLVVRDNGRGLPMDVIETGRLPGHFGLVGMRERAERIGGRFSIVSRPDAGTEVYVTVPGSLAYLPGETRAWRVL